MNWGCLNKIINEFRVIINQAAVMRARTIGQFFHHRFPSWFNRFLIDIHAGPQHGIDNLIKMPHGNGLVAVAVSYDFSLLRYPQ